MVRTISYPMTVGFSGSGLGLANSDKAAGVALYDEMLASPWVRQLRSYIGDPGTITEGGTVYSKTLEDMREYLRTGTGAHGFAWAFVKPGAGLRNYYEGKKAAASEAATKDRADRFRAQWARLKPSLADGDRLSSKADVNRLMNSTIRVIRAFGQQMEAGDPAFQAWLRSVNWEEIIAAQEAAVANLLGLISKYNEYAMNVLRPLVDQARQLIAKYGSLANESSAVSEAVANLSAAVAKDTPTPTTHYDDSFYRRWIGKLESGARDVESMAAAERDRKRREQAALIGQLRPLVEEAAQVLAQLGDLSRYDLAMRNWISHLDQAVRVDRSSPTGQYGAAWYRETIDFVRSRVATADKARQAAEATLAENKRVAQAALAAIRNSIAGAQSWAQEIGALRSAILDLLRDAALKPLSAQGTAVIRAIDTEATRAAAYVQSASGQIPALERIAQTGN